MGLGLIKDIIGCTTRVRTEIWLAILSAAYCVGVLAGAVFFGIVGSLAAAGLAATSHTIGSVLFCVKPASAEGTLAASTIMAIVAARPTRRPARPLIRRAVKTIRNPNPNYSKPPVQATGWKHEIRMPLASIEGAAYVLKDRAISPEQRLESARIIAKEGVRLHRLLESNPPAQPRPLSATSNVLSPEQSSDIATPTSTAVGILD